MSKGNKAILEAGNAAFSEGDNEGFLAFCADDTVWTFVGDRTLKGKEAVRRWMATTYVEPPKFRVAHLIAEGDFVTALGDITMQDEDGKAGAPGGVPGRAVSDGIPPDGVPCRAAGAG